MSIRMKIRDISRLARMFYISLLAIILSSPKISASTSQSATILLDQALKVLGGESSIAALGGITYHAPNIYRSRSLMQSYNLDKADTTIAVSGSQNISFSFPALSRNGIGELQQRIDRTFKPSDYWNWGSPRLDPFDFSLVIRNGSEDGFACYVKGNNQIWLPPNLASGYTDSALALYLVQEAEKLSPKLPLEMRSKGNLIASEIEINGIIMPSIFSSPLNLTLILDPQSSWPYIVRTYEMHPIYGRSTNDLYLTDYANLVKGSDMLFPTHVQTIYNSTALFLNAVLEDYYVESVTVNPNFTPTFFDGLPKTASFSPPSPPKTVEGISQARVSEFSTNMLWTGLKNTTVQELKSETPIKDLPGLHWLIDDETSLGVKQMIIEFDDEVIVCDAPPQWSTIVIEWIKQKIGKPIKHVFPSHHHRDHSGGVPDYVAIGAKIITPEIAADYWSLIPGAELVTFNDTHPLVYTSGSSNMQAWFRWEEQATHSADWAYTFVTTRCPDMDSPAVVFEADAWHPSAGKDHNDQVLMREWLDSLARDGVAKNTTVFPTHGDIAPLVDLIAVVGYSYPDHMTDDWMGGAASC